MCRKITFDAMSRSSKLHAERDNCNKTLENHKSDDDDDDDGLEIVPEVA